MKRRRVDDGESSDESSGSSPRTTPLAERKDNGRELTDMFSSGCDAAPPPPPPLGGASTKLSQSETSRKSAAELRGEVNIGRSQIQYLMLGHLFGYSLPFLSPTARLVRCDSPNAQQAAEFAPFGAPQRPPEPRDAAISWSGPEDERDALGGAEHAFSPDEMKVGEMPTSEFHMDDSWSELCSPGSMAGSFTDLCIEGKRCGIPAVLPAVGRSLC